LFSARSEEPKPGQLFDEDEDFRHMTHLSISSN
jgi:hypothetical protein